MSEDTDPVAEVVAELYALDPAEFVAARNDAAALLKKGGDAAGATALRKLPRPTMVAWAVNQALRADPSLGDRLTEVGSRLREAQATFDAAALAELRPVRDDLLDAAVRQAVTVAGARGQDVSGPAPSADIRATFVAGLADPAAEEAVRSGRLVKALSYTGFGEFDASAVADLPPLRIERSRPAVATSDRPGRGETGSRRKGDQEQAARERAEHAEAARERAVRERAREKAAREKAARDKSAREFAAAEQELREAEVEATAAGLDAAQAEAALTEAQERTVELRTLVREAEAAEAAAAEASAEAGAHREAAISRAQAAAAVVERTRAAAAAFTS